MADPGKTPGGPVPLLFLDQTEAERAEKKSFEIDSEPIRAQEIIVKYTLFFRLKTLNAIHCSKPAHTRIGQIMRECPRGLFTFRTRYLF